MEHSTTDRFGTRWRKHGVHMTTFDEPTAPPSPTETPACPCCGYSFRGHAGDSICCPECGSVARFTIDEDTERADQAARARSSLLVTSGAGLLAVLLGAVCMFGAPLQGAALCIFGATLWCVNTLRHWRRLESTTLRYDFVARIGAFHGWLIATSGLIAIWIAAVSRLSPHVARFYGLSRPATIFIVLSGLLTSGLIVAIPMRSLARALARSYARAITLGAPSDQSSKQKGHH